MYPSHGARLIYVCEDDDVMRDLLRRVLEKLCGGTVVTFAGGAEALLATKERVPQLLVADISHPGPSGIEMVRSLRAASHTQDLPIWIISGQAAAYGHEATMAGASLVIAKPFGIDEVNVHLKALFSTEVYLVDLDVEAPDFDIKERPGTETRDGAAALAKDVIAMANFGGGRILFGKRDNGDGSFTTVGLSETDRHLLEVTRLNQALQPFLDPPIHVSPRVIRRGALEMVELVVPPGEELVMAACQNDRASLYRGRIYVRTAAASSAEARSSYEVRRILYRLTRLAEGRQK